MSCQGCANAVNRVLGKIDGVKNIAADVPAKRVDVTHANTVKPEDLLTALKKWGDAANKSVELVGPKA